MLHRRCGRTVLPAAAVAMMLLLGACSNGGDAGNDNGGGNGSASEAGDSVRSSEGSVLTDSDCQRYAQAFQQIPNEANLGSGDGLQQAADSFNNAADEVPNEISADFRVVADAFAQFAQALNDIGLDPSDPQAVSEMSEEDLAALQSASQAMNDPAVQQAADNVTSFLEENCV
ncbi:MAG: hypothetical protein WD602_01135 [Actinomycetota bacterium]